MNINFKFPIVIFRNDYNDRTYYRFGISKKDQNGGYINGYLDCQFKNDVSLNNKDKIKVNSAWINFYLKNKRLESGKEIKETVPYVFINEFEKLESPVEYVQEVELEDIPVPPADDEQLDIGELDNFLE